MAYYTQANTRNTSFIESILDGAATALRAASNRYAKYSVYRETYGELAKLSDRDLNDLGLARSMIRGIAKEAAENNTGA